MRIIKGNQGKTVHGREQSGKIGALHGQQLLECPRRHYVMLHDVLGNQSDSEVVHMPITTLAPEPYDLLKDIPALLQAVDDGYTATFVDANISASGDTERDAVSNLRSLIVDIFVDLQSEAPERLGPEPTRQLAVLKSLIRKR